MESAMEHLATIIPMSDTSRRIAAEDLSPTALPDAFLKSDVAQAASKFHFPSFDELPHVNLYRDQVIGYIEGVLAPLSSCAEGPWLTPAMVNNYVKQRLVPAPTKKLYGREQIARLLVICVFKQFLSMDAIARMFTIQLMTYPVEVAFDYIATELNHAVADAFSAGTTQHEDSARVVTRESVLVRSAAAAFASKAFLMSYLAYCGYDAAYEEDRRR
ncbi:DUF1836 domain-containing protein [Collinsella tanakaei]|uniref:DUF1836 domain-containing protein n=1 Tax=Collinsella tanakaei TaxID=626935 RepID=UPI001EF5261C|nr:DUF1836 domain-containing protein [Collinsella tanakaei]